MSLICQSCSYRTTAEAGIRLSPCPRCAAHGLEAYLVEEATPRSRRRDLVGLLAIARAEIARARDEVDARSKGKGKRLTPRPRDAEEAGH